MLEGWMVGEGGLELDGFGVPLGGSLGTVPKGLCLWGHRDLPEDPGGHLLPRLGGPQWPWHRVAPRH